MHVSVKALRTLFQATLDSSQSQEYWAKKYFVIFKADFYLCLDMFTYKESVLLYQEFIVEYDIILAIYIPAVITYENLTVSQFVNI